MKMGEVLVFCVFLWVMKEGMRKYGLIGWPLGHSWSQRWMTEAFERLGIEARYDNYEMKEVGGLKRLLEMDKQLLGLNVTSPLKEAVIPLMKWIMPKAMAVGAVNVIEICRDGDQFALRGHNTDVDGFTEALNEFMPERTGVKALVLGTGGASKAVRVALLLQGIPYTVVSRTPGNGVCTYQQLTPEAIREHRLIINATPLGMEPHEGRCAPIPYEAIGPEHWCMDLIYNPERTEFLRRCQEQGAQICNGHRMLVGQAEATLRIWLPEAAASL